MGYPLRKEPWLIGTVDTAAAGVGFWNDQPTGSRHI
jgi:hypothetical protein